MFVTLRQAFTHVNMGMPIIVENSSFTDWAIFVSKLENLDTHFLMERQTHWKVLLSTNAAENCFFKTHF